MTVELDWPLMNLNWVDVPASVTCKLGMAGGTGTLSGDPPSKDKDSVAFSPKVMVSRSSDAVKLAALATAVVSHRQKVRARRNQRCCKAGLLC